MKELFWKMVIGNFGKYQENKMQGRLIPNDQLNEFLDNIISQNINDYLNQSNYSIDIHNDVYVHHVINIISNFIFEHDLIKIDPNYGGVGFNLNGSLGSVAVDIALVHLLLQNIFNRPFSNENLLKANLLNTKLKELNEFAANVINEKIERFDDDYVKSQNCEIFMNNFANFVTENELGSCSVIAYQILSSDENKGKSKEELQKLHKELESVIFKEEEPKLKH